MTELKVRLRLSLDLKEQFPEKLYDVCNDGALVKWNRNGSVSVTDENDFEQKVMKMYPGFLKIALFANFRRLFREYGFDWAISEKGELEFSHECFVRGRRILLSEIRTRRKSFQRPYREKEEPLIIQADPSRRYATRRRRKNVKYNSSSSNLSEMHETAEDSMSSCDSKCIYYKEQDTHMTIQNEPPNKLSKAPNQAFVSPGRVENGALESFARNEFTEEEYVEWLKQQRKFDNSFSDEDIRQTIDSQFVWMYYNDIGLKSETRNEEKYATEDFSLCLKNYESQEIPCGFCACCISMNESGLYFDIDQTLRPVK